MARPVMILSAMICLAQFQSASASVPMFDDGVRIYSARYEDAACTTLATDVPVVLVTAATQGTPGNSYVTDVAEYGHCECIDTTDYASIVTTADSLLGSEATGTLEETIDEQTDFAIAADFITVSPAGGTGVALKYSSSDSAITSITVTTAGTDYAVGDTLTIDSTNAMPGRSVNLVITLTAENLGAATPSARCKTYAITFLDTETVSFGAGLNRAPLLRTFYTDSACTNLAGNTATMNQLDVCDNSDASPSNWIEARNIKTDANALVDSAGTRTGTIDAQTDLAVATSDITWAQSDGPSDVAGTDVALTFSSTAGIDGAGSIDSITVTNAGAGYYVGNTLTIAASALGTRTTDLVITLVSDDLVMTTADGLGTTVLTAASGTPASGPYTKYSKTPPATVGFAVVDCALRQSGPNIVTAVDALLGSGAIGTAGFTATISGQIAAVAVAASSITVSPTGGTGVALEYTSTMSAISSITVTNAGAGYAVGDVLTIVNTALPGRTTDLVITLQAGDLTTLNDPCARSSTTSSPTSSPTTSSPTTSSPTTSSPTTSSTDATTTQTGNPASKVQASNMSTLFVALLVIMITCG